MVYDSPNEALMEILGRLSKKKIKLQKSLIETEIEIKLIEKQLTGGASLDEWFVKQVEIRNDAQE